MKYAQVVVNTPLMVTRPDERERDVADSLRVRSFTYSIPEQLESTLDVGQLVWVPFGTRRLQGVVTAFSETSPVEETKDIESIVDARPFLTAKHLDLAQWIARAYLCPLHDAIGLMLPPGVEQQTQTLISLVPDGPHVELTPKQSQLIELLIRDGESRLNSLPQDLYSSVAPLIKKGIVSKRTIIAPARAKPKRVNSIRLLVGSSSTLDVKSDVAGRCAQVVDMLRREGGIAWISAVLAETGCKRSDLDKLQKAGVIAFEEEEVWRDSLAGRTFESDQVLTLTPEQEEAWAEIRREILDARASSLEQAGDAGLTQGPEWKRRKAFLLHGVTGSGKTEIYMRALAETIAQGRQGIILVPEISLTPQTIRRFGARFKRMAIVHSRLWIGERYDTWRRCRDGLVDVVIGARSALFAPFPNLGLIAIDEEHDPSYKQMDSPYYHAREVALELARRTSAVVILGDATPDVETYYRATRGEFRLLELPKRVMGHRQTIEPTKSLPVQEADHAVAQYLDLPQVEVVDLRAELKAGNRSMFSRALQRGMTEALAANQQVILFLNRRGMSTCILCRDCGFVLKCKRCDTPLTYHGTGDQLVCHRCNRRDRVPTKCPNCGSVRIRYLGTGTEKVEAEIGKMFPKVRTLRWDWDVTHGKDSHEVILERFTTRQADILIGTQMIAKGLDLPFVTLVGVVSADTALNLPDFRSGERTFQLLTQVAGRAGRSILGGKVIVQTYSPDHYAVAAASTHDYHAFYEREIAFRREQAYPPFNRLIRLMYSHTNDKHALEESDRMARILATRIAQRGLPALNVIGPAPAFFRRVRGEFRYQIILLGVDPHALVADLALPLGWRIEVDPVSVL